MFPGVSWLAARLLGAAAQSFCHHPHHLQGEQGGFLDQGEEVGAIDDDKQAVVTGGGGGAARVVVDQGHFTKNSARADGDQGLVINGEVDLAVGDNVHMVARFALTEDDLAGAEGTLLFKVPG